MSLLPWADFSEMSEGDRFFNQLLLIQSVEEGNRLIEAQRHLITRPFLQGIVEAARLEYAEYPEQAEAMLQILGYTVRYVASPMLLGDYLMLMAQWQRQYHPDAPLADLYVQASQAYRQVADQAVDELRLALRNTAVAFAKEARPQQSLNYFQQAVEQAKATNASAEVMVDLFVPQAALQFAQGDFEASYHTLQRAVGLAKENSLVGKLGVLHNRLGDSAYEVGDVAAAVVAYRQVLLTTEDTRLRGDTSRSLGQIAERSGDFAQAEAAFQQALQAFQQAGDVVNIAKCWRDLASLALTQGHVAQAQAHLDAAYGVLGDEWPVEWAATVAESGRVAQFGGDYYEAIRLYEVAIGVYRGVGEKRPLLTLLSNVAAIYISLGDWQQAQQYLKEARTLAENGRWLRAQGMVLLNWGQTERLSGQLEPALATTKRARVLAQKMGDRLVEIYACHNLASLWWKKGALSQAKEMLAAALNLAKGFNMPRLHALHQMSLSEMAVDEGRYGEAARHLAEARSLYAQAGDQHGLLLGWLTQGILEMSIGLLETAVGTFQHTHQLASEMGSRRFQADALANWAAVAYQQNEWQLAADKYRAALDLYEALGSRGRLANQLCNIATLAESQGEFENAVALYEQALDIFREMGQKEGEVVALAGLGAVAHRQKDFAQAQVWYEAALPLAQQINAPERVRGLWTNLGFLAELKGDFKTAVNHYMRAVELVESGRRTLNSDDLRVSYLAHAKRIDPFSRLVLVTNQQNQPATSFNWSEASRSRAFLDLLHTPSRRLVATVAPLKYQQVGVLLRVRIGRCEFGGNAEDWLMFG